MALRQQLPPPIVVNARHGHEHTHTVVFLHRFPESTTDEELRRKVLSEKLTKNHKTLRRQFPSVRWVFPFGKAHARPWNNLSPDDRKAVGMTMGAVPYITQIILREAKRAGGLDRIILGGQGETAEAAHEAMSSFPEGGTDLHSDPKEMSAFIKRNYHLTWTQSSQLRLGGFVGMHLEDGQPTRDVKTLALISKEAIRPQKISNNIITNTPHKFIHGGYKIQTTTWDGARIDQFAEFLAGIGVFRIPDKEQKIQETLVPKDRAKVKKFDPREGLNDVQKYALEVAEQKKLDALRKEKVLVRIEADKVERNILQERKKQRRLHGGEVANTSFTGSVNRLG
ncbi:uncharacterized protein CTRU02_207927 [Colletotrichum truncatum]|uniref:Uncharacterized protein n=1 Tax=Colletotrichum truncatum TaxID=5467 RepID=A0ACC3Z272_COLTU|nr:uncharacterized protein CTRU02_11050 [Colletotrichum truncatum]KAF6786552.1 hypothetical protein CTRU02_11050 [Colletotrichum truncatum]